MNVQMVGHCVIKEHDYTTDSNGNITPTDDGTVIRDEYNAVHPQNMARAISRGLSNESNYFIHRIGFGNGGTTIDVANNVSFKTPRDGLNPGDNHWEARLYNETYSEIVDDSNVNIGTGEGSAAGDPITVEHVSGPGVRSVEDLLVGATVSNVVITAVLNPNEPNSQVLSQQGGLNGETNLESNFTFDELGLFTAGAPDTNTAGYQDVDVGNKDAKSDTGLAASTQYTFSVVVDSSTNANITIMTPAVGTGDGTNAPTNSITFGDLVTILNASGSDLDNAGAFVEITDDTPIQDGGSETFGFLRFSSKTSGSTSSIVLSDGDLFSSISGFQSINPPVNGRQAGVRNDPVNPTNERERMITHLIFSPVTKSADRLLTITYTLSILVARTVS